MQRKVYLVLSKCIWFYNAFIFSNVNALAGEDTRRTIDGEFPFVVSMGQTFYNSSYHHSCAGSLVSKKDILTAAHCLDYSSQDVLKIAIGSVDFSLSHRYTPLFWITYDQWCEFYQQDKIYAYNDIAVIRLLQLVPDYIEPGVLRYERSRHFVNYDVSLLGWGRRSDIMRSTVLETGYSKVYDLSVCGQKVYQLTRRAYYFQPTIFCTFTDPYLLIIDGDSGGPVLHMNEIIGINLSTCPFRDIAIHPGKINTHTEIFFYRYFIESIINDE